MQPPVSSTRELVHLAWPMLVAQLAIMATVLMSLVSVLLALPPIIAHLYGAGKRAEIGREIHQGIWISLLLALVAILLLRFPGPFMAISELRIAARG